MCKMMIEVIKRDNSSDLIITDLNNINIYYCNGILCIDNKGTHYSINPDNITNYIISTHKKHITQYPERLVGGVTILSDIQCHIRKVLCDEYGKLKE